MSEPKQNGERSFNILLMIIVGSVTTACVMFGGEPDIADAIVYWLTEGNVK